MTPAEVKGRLKAYSAAQKQALEAQDNLAWMAGAYFRMKNYPRKPHFVKREPVPQEPMTPEQMKAAMREFAARQNEVIKNGDNP